MPEQVLIFSADEVRGGIARKILERNGFEVLLLGRILGLREAIAEHNPRVVILDTYGCIAEEIKQIKNLCQTLRHTLVILLGEPAIILGMEGTGPGNQLCLSDPLDPDLFVTKVREAFSSKAKGTQTETGALEKDLEHLLKLG